MGDISIQYHALPDENAAFVRSIVENFDVSASLMCILPFSVQAVSKPFEDDFFTKLPPYSRFVFTNGVPVLSVNDELQFSDKNEAHLRLDVGRLTEQELEQSWLSARTKDPLALRKWKSIAKDLRSRTRAGVLATNPATNSTTLLKSFRYTPGAKTVSLQGIKMRPFAGGSVITFPD